MSKTSEYREQLSRMAKDAERQSVTNFAAQLGKSPESLLSQLRDAGIPKASAVDSITSADKQALLTHLQKVHGVKTRRKKIANTLDNHEKRLERVMNSVLNFLESPPFCWNEQKTIPQRRK